MGVGVRGVVVTRRNLPPGGGSVSGAAPRRATPRDRDGAAAPWRTTGWPTASGAVGAAPRARTPRRGPPPGRRPPRGWGARAGPAGPAGWAARSQRDVPVLARRALGPLGAQGAQRLDH